MNWDAELQERTLHPSCIAGFGCKAASRLPCVDTPRRLKKPSCSHPSEPERRIPHVSRPRKRDMYCLRSAFVIAALLLTGCKHTTAPDPIVTGAWRGSVGSQVIALSLAQTGSVVSGSGTISGTPRGTLAMTVNGTFAHPTLSITMTNSLVQASNITATMTNSGVLSGAIQGSGFTGEAISLVRQ